MRKADDPRRDKGNGIGRNQLKLEERGGTISSQNLIIFHHINPKDGII